jgi:hypothetical protein
MKRLFNVTAQVYRTNDPTKQTILFNQEVFSDSETNAKSKFEHYYLVPHYNLVKIYSVEEISQEMA